MAVAFSKEQGSTWLSLTCLISLWLCSLEVNRSWCVLADVFLLSQLAEVDFLLVFAFGIREAIVFCCLLGG